MAQRTGRSGEELDARAREVLRQIVMEYISSGEPISSRWLSRCGRFSLSPASLRNVMADLEEMGYLYQPHTSAGRVPTDSGYRFFINHLMRSRKLSAQERQVIDGEVSRADELDQVMHLASRLLSKLSDHVGVVFVPKLHKLVMRSIDFIPVSDSRIMCIIVGTNGVVVNRVIESPSALSREELERVSRYLSVEYAGITLEKLVQALQVELGSERHAEDAKWRQTMSLGVEAVNEVIPHDHELYVEGAISMLTKGDYLDPDEMRRAALAFEEKDRLIDILRQLLSEHGLHILIGSENSFTANYNFSVVATPYGTSEPLGLVGIIGPTRMEYGRIAPLVEYLAGALGRKIEEREQEQDRD